MLAFQFPIGVEGKYLGWEKPAVNNPMVRHMIRDLKNMLSRDIECKTGMNTAADDDEYFRWAEQRKIVRASIRTAKMYIGVACRYAN